MKIEVLATTMFQKDLTKYKEMNIQTDVVFANQDDRHEYIEERIEGNFVKMVTTPYRGVGKNRNMALLSAAGDILLFGDDDLIYVDGYGVAIEKAFESIPDADIILFNLGTLDKEDGGRVNLNCSKVNLLNVLNYGMPRVAIRRSSIEKANLWITTLFGGGSKYCGGEDNLFLVTALKKGLKIYTHPFYIGMLKKRESTWFDGFNEKFFFDNGAFLETAFPVLKHPFAWYFAVKFSKKSEQRILELVGLQYEGMKAFRRGMSYDHHQIKHQ